VRRFQIHNGYVARLSPRLAQKSTVQPLAFLLHGYGLGNGRGGVVIQMFKGRREARGAGRMGRPKAESGKAARLVKGIILHLLGFLRCCQRTEDIGPAGKRHVRPHPGPPPAEGEWQSVPLQSQLARVADAGSGDPAYSDKAFSCWVVNSRSWRLPWGEGAGPAGSQQAGVHGGWLVNNKSGRGLHALQDASALSRANWLRSPGGGRRFI